VVRWLTVETFPNLSDVADRLIHDGGKPNFFFLNQEGKVVGVSLDKNAAIAAGMALGESKAAYVEDRTSKVWWGNRRYERYLAVDTDETAALVAAGGGATARSKRRAQARRPRR
jgi:hypothetical protein